MRENHFRIILCFKVLLVHYSISLSLAQTLPLLSINYLSLCTNLLFLTGKLLNVFFDTSSTQFSLAYRFIEAPATHFKHSQMLIGLAVGMTDDPLEVSASTLAKTLFPRGVENKLLLLVPALKLNTKLWQTLLLNLSGFNLFFLNFVSPYQLPLSFGVIILVPHIYPPIQCFMPAPNMLKSISILSVIWLPLSHSMSALSPAVISLQIY